MMTLLVIAGLATQLTASGVAAQPLTQRGNNEVSVHVSPDFEGAVGDMLSAEAGYGRFISDDLLVKALLLYTVLEDVAGEDEDYRTSEIGLAAEYHFAIGERLVPYAGVGVGWRSSHFGDFAASDLVYGPRAGVKYFVADNVALGLDITYKLAGSNVFINDFQAEDVDLTPSVGLRWFF